jgi:hypothetical protein
MRVTADRSASARIRMEYEGSFERIDRPPVQLKARMAQGTDSLLN